MLIEPGITDMAAYFGLVLIPAIAVGVMAIPLGATCADQPCTTFVSWCFCESPDSRFIDLK